jgi:hypothetical protein
MKRQKYQFSLRTLVSLTIVSAIVSGMSVGLPNGQFPFEIMEARRPLTFAELLKRIAFLAVTIGVLAGGLLLLTSQYKRLRKRRQDQFSKQRDDAIGKSPLA